MKCLLISTNALGDTYLSCSAIDALKIYNGDAKIDMIANSGSSLFLPYLDLNEVFYLKEKKIRSVLELYKKIKRNKYDYSFCFFPGLVNTFFFLKIKSRIKSGFINYIKHNEWFDREQSLTVKGITENDVKWTPEMNFLDRIKIALNGAGIVTGKIRKPVFDIKVKPEEKNYILLHPFSKEKNKSIPENLLKEICNFISVDLKYEIIIIASLKNTHEQSLSFANVIYDPPLALLINLITGSRLYIGVDSFPIHIADSYDANILGVFSGTNPSSVFQKKREYVSIELPLNEIENKIRRQLP